MRKDFERWFFEPFDSSFFFWQSLLDFSLKNEDCDKLRYNWKSISSSLRFFQHGEHSSDRLLRSPRGSSNRNKPRKARAVGQKNMDGHRHGGVQTTCGTVCTGGRGRGPTAATHMLRREASVTSFNHEMSRLSSNGSRGPQSSLGRIK